MLSEAWWSADALFGLALLVSVLVGLMRGLVMEAMSLAGWFIAFAVAPWLMPHAVPYLPIGESAGALNHAAAFLVCYMVVLLVWWLFARLLQMLVRNSPLSWPDRLFGGVFGLARGVVLLTVLTVLVLMTPLAQSPWWQRSDVVPWVQALVQGVRPLLPQELLRWLPG